MSRTLWTLAVIVVLASGCKKREAQVESPTGGALPAPAKLSVDVRALPLRGGDGADDGAELDADEPNGQAPRPVESPPPRGPSKGEPNKGQGQPTFGNGPGGSEVAEDKKRNQELAEGARRSKRVGAATAERTSGSVDPSVIQRAVAEHPDLFSRCLQSGDASIELDATISPSGQIVEAKSTQSVPDDALLRDCLVEAFKMLSVGKLEGDAPARVRFAIALKRAHS